MKPLSNAVFGSFNTPRNAGRTWIPQAVLSSQSGVNVAPRGVHGAAAARTPCSRRFGRGAAASIGTFFAPQGDPRTGEESLFRHSFTSSTGYEQTASERLYTYLQLGHEGNGRT